MYQFICQIHIDPVLTLIISAPNVLPPSFLHFCLPAQAQSPHTRPSAAGLHTPLYTSTQLGPRIANENKLSITHKHLQRSYTNQNT